MNKITHIKIVRKVGISSWPFMCLPKIISYFYVINTLLNFFFTISDTLFIRTNKFLNGSS